MASELTGRLVHTGFGVSLHITDCATMTFDADHRLLRRMSEHVGKLVTVALDDSGFVTDFTVVDDAPEDVASGIPISSHGGDNGPTETCTRPSRTQKPGGNPFLFEEPLTRGELREELARALTPPKPEPQPEPTLVLRQYGENKRLRVVEKREARDGEGATWVCEVERG